MGTAGQLHLFQSSAFNFCITIGSLLAPEVEGLAIYSLPSGVYGVLMYAVSLPMIAWLRFRSDAEEE